MIGHGPGRPLTRLAAFATGATLAASTGLAAQEPPLGTPAPPEPPCVCEWGMQAPEPMRSFFRFNRARIGVELGETVELGGRSGIRVADVEDGGPADRAGIREGDVLLSLNGDGLGDEPVDGLLDLLGDVEPGDTVTVEYGRDGRTGTARVVTDRRRGFSFAPGEGPAVWTFPAPGEMRERIGAPGARVYVRQLLGGGVDLVEMNEGLGGYFGTAEGVLVADVPEQSALGLRPGDVILSIDGRAVRDPAHARSIIASYRPDETISFEVMRERRRSTVTGTRGER